MAQYLLLRPWPRLRTKFPEMRNNGWLGKTHQLDSDPALRVGSGCVARLYDLLFTVKYL
jgi:hypothetical protein